MTDTTVQPTADTPVPQLSIGDVQAKTRTGQACYFSCPVITKAQLTDALHPVNDALYSGKQLGAAVINEDGVMMIALGDKATDKWVGAFSDLTITPTGTLPTIPLVTGDKQRKATRRYTTDLIFPVVPKADLGKAENPINHKHYSGKQKGAYVVDEFGKAYCAFGSQPTDKWIGQVDITPVVPEGGIPNDMKPSIGQVFTARNSTQCHVGIPVVTPAELTADESFLNNRWESNKQLGALATRTDTCHLHVALGVGVGTGFKDQVSATSV